MNLELTPAAQNLLDRLTAPVPDHPAFVGTSEPVDISQISREELGVLWMAMTEVKAGEYSKLHYQTYYEIDRAISETGHYPLLNEEQLQRYLSALKSEQRDIWDASRAIDWRVEPFWPIPAKVRKELRRLIEGVVDLFEPIKYVGNDEPSEVLGMSALRLARELQKDEQGIEVEQLIEKLRAECADTRYKKLELELLLTLRLAEWCPQTPQYIQKKFSCDSRYQQHYEFVLRDACAHLESIHNGEVTYLPYKAFSDLDVDAIYSAYYFHLRSKTPWFPELAQRLLVLLSHAPDKVSKSLPSQSLCCKVAQEISLFPTPEGIASMQAALASVINATVKRVLATRLKQAKTALALRPEVVLGLLANGEPNKKQQTLLGTLLQSSYWTGLEFSLADWKAQLLEPSGSSEYTQKLVWYAQSPDTTSGFSFMPEILEDGVLYRDQFGQIVQVPEQAKIRLWHPLHSAISVRDAWQQRLTQIQLRQPIRQVFREYYFPLEEELTPDPSSSYHSNEMNSTERYAGFMVQLKPMIGIAKGETWKIDSDHGLIRNFGDITVTFAVDTELHPGIEGDVETCTLGFWKNSGGYLRAEKLSLIPPIIFSEACRAVDLLVSVCSFAYVAEDSFGPLTFEEMGFHINGQELPQKLAESTHPALQRLTRIRFLAQQNLANMLGMRVRVLKQAFAKSVETTALCFEGRHAIIGNYQLNLSTGIVTKLGMQIEIPLHKTKKGNNKLGALPWLPYDEAMLEKNVQLIAYLLAENRS